jgi:hypothetical protein
MIVGMIERKTTPTIAAAMAVLGLAATTIRAEVLFSDNFSDSPPELAMNGRTVDGFTWTADADLVSAEGALRQTFRGNATAYLDFSSVEIGASDVVTVSFDVAATSGNTDWVRVAFTDRPTTAISPDPGLSVSTRLDNYDGGSLIVVDGTNVGPAYGLNYDRSGRPMPVEIEWDLGAGTVTHSSYGVVRATRSVPAGIPTDNFVLTVRNFDRGISFIDNLEISVNP